MHEYTIQRKLEYPQCIILVQVGDFWETMGIDSMVS